MPLGCRTVPGAAPACPASWAGEEGPRPGGARGHLPPITHTHRQPGPKSWCPSAPAPACSHLWDSHQPGVTGLGPEAAPGTCRTSASGGTALRRSASPEPKVAHRRLEPAGAALLPALRSSPSDTGRKLPSQPRGPTRPRPAGPGEG